MREGVPSPTSSDLPVPTCSPFLAAPRGPQSSERSWKSLPSCPGAADSSHDQRSGLNNRLSALLLPRSGVCVGLTRPKSRCWQSCAPS